ncbi:MAG: TadE/TadG family type IV pilus assembly protein [Candidatus Dormibacter sp.]|uniref:TadE/TadG family type IV pilus assembly protein n=1 Tax=Candidatus Dormibacter sp. TaxID=2973982 RepID=UPI000DB75F89|nr:MAG: hypothetical protein DLM66_06265 [Candidatus Dormibacteraeota bacterium]
MTSLTACIRAGHLTQHDGPIARHHQRGQALVETAIVLPLLFLLFLGFLLVMVTAQAYVDVDTATSLAAASAVTAPANDSAKSREFALQTYNGTLHQSTYLQPQALAGCGGYAAGGSVTCTGRATQRWQPGRLLSVPLPVVAGILRLRTTMRASRRPVRRRHASRMRSS